MQCDIYDMTKSLPVLAMSGDTACAAAFYWPTLDDAFDSFRLARIIRSAEKQCRGSGAAILCYLIRNSKNAEGHFSPLWVPTLKNDAIFYFESFGCTGGVERGVQERGDDHEDEGAEDEATRGKGTYEDY